MPLMATPDNPDGPDPLEALDQELRERVGGEFRRTAEEDEFAARKAALRGRDLAQVAYELLSRGDTIRVTIGSTSIRGVLTHARATLATLSPSEGPELHLNLAGPLTIDGLWSMELDLSTGAFEMDAICLRQVPRCDD